MALSNFYEIMVEIIGSPANDYEQFLVYTVSTILGLFIILFVFQLFMLVISIFKPTRK